MKVMDVMIAANYQITESSEYLWCCYGENARHMDFGDNITCVYDTKTQDVYELVVIKGDDEFNRWRDPRFIKANNQDAKARGIDNKIAVDNIRYSDVKSEERILDMVEAVISDGANANYSSDSNEDTCHECNSELENAPGIGPYCPNSDCDVVDGFFGNAFDIDPEYDEYDDLPPTYADTKTYNVKMSVAFSCTVDATTMQDAIETITEFVNSMAMGEDCMKDIECEIVSLTGVAK